MGGSISAEKVLQEFNEIKNVYDQVRCIYEYMAVLPDEKPLEERLIESAKSLGGRSFSPAQNRTSGRRGIGDGRTRR